MEETKSNILSGLDLEEVQELLQERLSTLPNGYRLPYMQWYEDDFKGSDGVSEMLPIERLMYRQLLAKAWSSKEAPYLPTDKIKLMRLADCPDEATWKKHGPCILAMFARTSDKKRLYHPRQLRDYTKQIAKISSSTENGKKGGRPAKPKKTNDNRKTQLEPKHIPAETQPEQEPEPYSEPKPDQKPESTLTAKQVQEALDFYEEEILPNLAEGAEESDMTIKELKKNFTKVALDYGVKLGGYQSTWDDLKILADEHGSGALVRDFDSWLSEGHDFNDGVLSAYSRLASDRLSSDSAPALASARDPEVVSLVRELTYLSDGQISFLDKQRVRLAEVLKEFSGPEILSAFKVWLQDQDLNDPKTSQYGPGKFVQIVDSLCYSARKRKQESDQAAKDREIAVKRLQEEAELDRKEIEKARQEEESAFDPLAD